MQFRPALLRDGILAAAEAIECIGGQIGQNGDRAGALFAALIVDHLMKAYPEIFSSKSRWRNGLPADLGRIVYDGLNNASVPAASAISERAVGLEAVSRVVLEHPLVARYLAKGLSAQQGDEAVGGPPGAERSP